jgi:hypothetical protein
MSAVLQRALGSDFDRLHPRIREQYGTVSRDHRAFKGRGVMEEIRRGRFYTLPFLRLGAMRNAMFGETGHDVPFTIENYAYLDRFGRETLTWARRFELPQPRRFDETLIYSERRRCALVYMGTHQHLAVELSLSVDAQGALVLRTGAQRLYEWSIGIRFPLLFSGTALVRESFNDSMDRFEVDVRISNPVWGEIFSYRGWFTGGMVDCPPDQIPREARPIREERRE